MAFTSCDLFPEWRIYANVPFACATGEPCSPIGFPQRQGARALTTLRKGIAPPLHPTPKGSHSRPWNPRVRLLRPTPRAMAFRLCKPDQARAAWIGGRRFRAPAPTTPAACRGTRLRDLSLGDPVRYGEGSAWL